MDLDTYEREGRHAYGELARTVAAILNKVAEDRADYRLQQVQHRAKGVLSLRKKLIDREVAESDAIELEIKDLAGVRAIFYTNADVSRFISSGVIGENFDVDWNRTKFHYPMKDPTAEDGFISYNYVVQLKADRLALPEYAPLSGLSCEIQIQTTLDHAWSEMAHDTIYKVPAPGFGTSAMKSVSDRMTEIMQRYLRPAGFEFQKVVADVRAFERARLVAERDPIRQIADASNNNERHERLKEFRETLNYYDDLPERAAVFRRTVVDAIEAARATPTTPWAAHGISFEGVPLAQVVDDAYAVIDRLRFVSLDAVDGTLEALAELQPNASEDEEKYLKRSVERLAKHNMNIWQTAGPVVEQRLVAVIGGWDSAKRHILEGLVVEALGYVLQTNLTGESSTYNMFTFHQGAVVASEAYLATRRDALVILEALLQETQDAAVLRKLLIALDGAGRLPDHGNLSADLLGAVLSDSLHIVRFMTAYAAKLPYEIRQRYERDLLWLYRHLAALPPEHRQNGVLEAMRLELRSAILAYRDAVNTEEDFSIYKTLVGFNSVFPPAWEDDGFDVQGEAAYRLAAIGRLVIEVSDANFDRWLGIIDRCTASDAMDGGGCTGFRTFLVELGRAKPELLERLFNHMNLGLNRFVASMLQGLEAGSHDASAVALMRGWLTAGEHLGEIANYLEISKVFDPTLLAAAVDAAISRGEELSVARIMGVGARRYAEAPEAMVCVFLKGLAYFTERRSGAWAGQVWFLARQSEFFDHLDPSARSQMLASLVYVSEITFHLEELLQVIVSPSPAELLPFFAERLAQARNDGRARQFEAIPFEFHGLKESFESIPIETVAAVRAWFDTEEQVPLFQYYGGSLISRAFPIIEPVLTSLNDLVDRGAEGDIEFVLRVLMSYNGEIFVLPLCRDIVSSLEEGSPLLGMVDTVLDQSGVVAGEFGFVEQHQQRRAEIAPWLVDSSPKVRAFAEQRSRRLDLQTASEQRRSLEALELRKRHYGE